MGKDEKSIYKSTQTQGVTENVIGTQTIQTKATRVLEGDGVEVLIGKDIDEVKKVAEDHESLQRRILHRMMK